MSNIKIDWTKGSASELPWMDPALRTKFNTLEHFHLHSDYHSVFWAPELPLVQGVVPVQVFCCYVVKNDGAADWDTFVFGLVLKPVGGYWLTYTDSTNSDTLRDAKEAASDLLYSVTGAIQSGKYPAELDVGDIRETLVSAD